MEANEDNQPSLPPNYVSLADLQRRWRKQQEEESKKEKQNRQPILAPIGGDDAKKQLQQKRRENEQLQLQQPNFPLRGLTGPGEVMAKPQFRRVDSSITNANPNLCNRTPFRKNYRGRKGLMEYRMMKSNTEIKHSKVEGVVSVRVAIDGGDQSIDDQVDQVAGEQKAKVERKAKKKKYNKNKKNPKAATEEQTKGERGEERGEEVKGGGEAPLKLALTDQPMEVEEKLKKLSVKGRTWKNNGKSIKPARNGDCGEERENEVKANREAPLKPAMGDRTVEVDDKFKKVFVNERVWRSNGNSTKPARNSECEEERENEVKTGNETPLKPAVDDGKVEVEEKFNKVFVNGRVWRSNGRPAAVIQWPKRTFRARGNGRVEHRGMGRMTRETWVKKGEVPEHTGELKL